MTLPPCSKAELRVYDRDGTTLRDTVIATGLSWLDPISEVGSATLTAPILQAAYEADPLLLEDGIVKVALDLVPGDPLVEVFAFLCEGGEFAVVTEKDAAGWERSLQCRGLLALFDDWIVYPEIGLTATAADQRTFGWMSGASDRWFDEDAWSATIEAKQWSDYAAGSDRYQLPKGWPDPNAYWVKANSSLKQYFRREITVSEDTPVKVYVSADENLRVFLDSELILENKSHEVGYTDLNEWTGVLSAGQHTFGVKFLKRFDVGYSGWSGWDTTDSDRMIFTCWSLNADGSLDTRLIHSSDSDAWLAVGRDEGERPPTWTPAGIVGQLKDEADARGVQSAGRITLDFTEAEDSDGDPWPDLHERQWSVGAKGTQVLSDLAELGVDWDMRPDLTLKAYASQGSDLSDTVALQVGVNILSYRIADQPVLATTLLVRSEEGWVEVTATAAEEESDRREDFLSSGDSLSDEQATHLANKTLADIAFNHRVATAEIIAVPGCVPYLDFGKGDTIMALTNGRNPSPRRVVSIAPSVPESGPVRFTLEMEEV